MNVLSLRPGERLELQLARHRWQGLRLRTAGGFADVEAVELEDAALAWVADEQGAPRLAGLQAAAVRVSGLRLHQALDTSGSRHRPERSSAARAPLSVRLDALEGVQGSLQAFVADAAWILDAAVTLPVRGGVIDFDQVLVEHLGPDSSMGVSAGGLYIDAPRMPRRFLYLFTGAIPAGIEPEQRQGRWIQRRGRLGLAALFHGLLQDGVPAGQWANPQAEAAMARSRLAGELQLGDGPLGVEGLQLELAGHALGANRVSVAAAALSSGLVVRCPQFVASAARLSVAGLHGGCGPVEGQWELQLTPRGPAGGGRPASPEVRVQAASLTLRELRLA